MNGILKSIDSEAVTVTKDGKDVRTSIAPGATITCEGEECKIEELKVGEEVIVTGTPATKIEQ